MRLIYKRTAFTLAELLIATSLLTLVVMAAFSLYSSSTKNFIIGSWRLEEQKRLQRLNSDLTRDLSAAVAGLYNIDASGVSSKFFDTPIYINKNLYSEDENAPKALNVNIDTWQCLIAFSIATQHIAESPSFGISEVKGKWQGTSLWAKGGKLKYLRTGDHNKYGSTPITLPATINYPGPAVVGNGLNFESEKERNGEKNSDTSVEEISIIGKKTSGSTVSALEITTKSIRKEGGRHTDTELTQKVLMKIASGTIITTF